MTADLAFCRQEFPALGLTVNGKEVAFFDGPGGTQVPRRVIDAVVSYYERSNANCHGEFETSRRTDAMIAQAREMVAEMLGAESPEEIAFGANMTSLNFALSRALGRRLVPGDEIVVTDLDHEANRSPWQALEEKGVVVKSVHVNLPECTLDYNDFERKVGPRTKIVAVGYASNAVGTINDVKRAAALAHSVGAVCVVDAVHYALHGPVDVKDVGCDFLLCSAYKFFGPHVGILYGRKEVFAGLETYKVRPQLAEAPFKIETGTLNHEGIAGVIEAVKFIADLGAKAVEESGQAMEVTAGESANPVGGADLRARIVAGFRAIEQHERPLLTKLMAGLAAVPGVTIYGLPAEAKRTPTVAFTLKGRRPAEVAKYLGDRGVFVGSGDFYATTLIEKLGLAETGGVVRAGLAPYNTVEEVERLIEGVEELV